MRSASISKTMAAMAIGLAIASGLAPSTKAGPEFSMRLDVPGIPDAVDVFRSPAPIIRAIDGTDGSFGSGSAFGRSQLGILGAKTTVVNSEPFFRPDYITASRSDVSFRDGFVVHFPGPFGNGVLIFTVSLDGTTSVTGDPLLNIPDVRLVFSGSTFFSARTAVLTGPGMITIDVPIEVGTPFSVFLDADLAVESGSLGPGGVIADFSSTFKINAVQLFDTHGHFLRDVTLVDDAGNVLPVSPLFAVPEPGSISLLAIGMGALGTIGLRSRNRDHPESRRGEAVEMVC